MQSVEFKVLDGSLPKQSLIFWMQIGILVASPTSSMKSIFSFATPIIEQKLVSQQIRYFVVILNNKINLCAPKLTFYSTMKNIHVSSKNHGLRAL